MNDIVIKNLTKSYGEKIVLKGVDIGINYGERIAFMAPSGYGKTTLLRVIFGLEKQDSGEISGVPEKKAVVFQEDRLFEEFSVKTNVKFAQKAEYDDKFVENILSDFKLLDDSKKPVKSLSGGMKRRVSIVRALVSDFDILAMDEPFKGLDAGLKDEIISATDKYTVNKTLLLVTHDRKEAEKLGCRILDLETLNFPR